MKNEKKRFLSKMLRDSFPSYDSLLEQAVSALIQRDELSDDLQVARLSGELWQTAFSKTAEAADISRSGEKKKAMIADFLATAVHDRKIDLTKEQRRKIIAGAVDAGFVSRQAAKGIQFPSGKPEGAKGPFRKRIDALLKKNPAMKNPELWAAIAKKPPQGWAAMDNSMGKYFERQNPDGKMEYFDYTTFIKRASEARKLLK